MFDFDPAHPNPPLEGGTLVVLKSTDKTQDFKMPQTARIHNRTQVRNYFTYSVKGIGKNGEEIIVHELLCRTDFDTVR